MIEFLRGILRYGVWLCGLALASGYLSGYAQLPTAVPDTRTGRLGLEEILAGRRQAVQPGETFFEGPIDPAEYIVGPGDRLSLVFWEPTFSEQPVTVNGEGSVVVPYVGIVPLGGLTLQEARERVESAVRSSMRVGRATVALVEPRRFRVHVAGLVVTPGSYVLPATARVSDAIQMAGGLAQEIATTGRDSVVSREVSQRRIELLDRDGRLTGHADLLRFRQSGDMRGNPLLRDGQVIRVPYTAEPGLTIGVFGAVHESGNFEHAEGDRLTDALALGGGLTPRADSTAVTVVGADGRRSVVDLRTTAADLPLTPGDRVYVAGHPDTSRIGSVDVNGEVTRPGGYPIVRGVTTVREILDQAGGLLPTAAAGSARLVRRNPPELVEPERERVLTVTTVPGTPAAYAADIGLAAEFSRWGYSTVVLDLTDGDAAEVRLQDGDRLLVPSQPLGVRVLGFVNHAGEVEWRPGETLGYYLEQAGGLNAGGWRRQTVLVKARNGSQVRYSSELPIDPGDVIYVPAKPQTTAWQNVTNVVGVTAQLVSLFLIISTIGQ